VNVNGTQSTKDVIRVAVAMWSHADVIQMTSAVLLMTEVNVLSLNKQNNWYPVSANLDRSIRIKGRQSWIMLKRQKRSF
jgi:hypothetical protein